MAVKENIVIDVTVDTGDATNTIDGIENRIEELIAQRNELQIGTKEFEKVSREIQGLQTDIKNVELQFESLDFEQKLTAGMDAVTGLAGGFVAAEGAMLLFGTESEALEETLRRVGGALALTSGLRDLANGVIAMRKFGLATKLATARQWALNVAMNANPIGLIVLALAALTAGVLAYAAATAEVSKEERLAAIRKEELTNATKEAMKSIVEEKVEVESLVKVARDRNASDKARAEAVKQLNELSPEHLGALTTENVLTEEGIKLINDYNTALEKRAMAEALQSKLVEFNKQKIENLFKAEEDLVGAQDLSKLTLSELLDVEKARARRKEIAIENAEKENQAIDEKITVLKEMLHTSKDEELQTDANTRAYESNIKAREQQQETIKNQEAELSAFYQAVEQVETEHFDKFITDQQKEINAVTDKFFELITLAEQYGEDTKLLEDAREKALADIRKKYRDEEAQIREQLKMESFAEEEELAEIIRQANQTQLQNEMDDVNAHYFDLIERAKQYGLDTTALEKERTDKLAELQIESEQKVFDAKMQLAQASIGILQGLQGLVKQGSDAQKALALTEIAANTAIGFIQGLNVAQKAAAGTGPAAAYAFPIFYASQVAAVLAAAGKAKSILGKGGGGGSAPSIPSAGATAGAGGVPLNNISNTAALVDQQQQEITTQVVVLESDITTTQENVTAVSELSSF